MHCPCLVCGHYDSLLGYSIILIGFPCGGPKAYPDTIYSAVDILLLVLLNQQKFYEESEEKKRSETGYHSVFLVNTLKRKMCKTYY